MTDFDRVLNEAQNWDVRQQMRLVAEIMHAIEHGPNAEVSSPHFELFCDIEQANYGDALARLDAGA